MDELGGALLELFHALSGSTANLPSDEYRTFGELVGSALAGIVTWPAAAISVTASFFTSLAKGATAVVQVFSAVFNHLYDWFVTVRSFLTALAESIRSAFASLSDGVIDLLRRVPTQFLPAEYQWLARQPLSTEVQQQLTMAMPTSTPSPDLALTHVTTSAAVSSCPATSASRGGPAVRRRAARSCSGRRKTTFVVS